MLYFAILGGVEVVGDGDRMVIDRPQRRALLAYLLINANRTVTHAQIAEALWGASIPTSVRTQIHASISSLRKHLGDERILTRDGGYQLQLAGQEFDLLTFRALAAQEETLREALNVWRGQALSGIEAPFAHGARVALEEERLTVWERLSEAELDNGKHADLVPDLTQLLADYPLRERIAERLMVALYRSGRQADALDVARTMRSRLADELGLDPSRSLMELEQSILRAEVRLDPPPAFVPAVSVVPAQLPPDVADFTGRARHLGQLDRGFQALAIVGSGGMGKSTLAVHWAHRVRDRFPDGQLYVNMHGYDAIPMTPCQALAGFLRGLGVRPEQIPTVPAETAALYRTMLAGRRMLVIVDNVSSADQVRLLLPGSSETIALITSRDRLTGLAAVDGVTRLELDLLTQAEAHTLLMRVIGDARVAAEPQAVADLAALCGYLPLALRIAAAQLADWPEQPISAYVKELRDGDVLSSLDIEGDSASSVRETFALSYRRLAKPEQRLFRLLGLVPGTSFTAAAASQLIDIEARRLLDRLSTVHLIQRLPSGRYQFHDLLRQYAESLALRHDSASERDAAMNRLLDYLLDRSTAAAQRLYPARLRLHTDPASEMDEQTAIDWVESEREGVVAAVHYAADRPVAWKLVDVLRAPLYFRGYAADLMAVSRSGLAAAEHHGDKRAQTITHLSLGMALIVTNAAGDGLKHFSRALEFARELDWPQAINALLNNASVAHIMLGDMRQARSNLAEASGANPIAVSKVNLGIVEHYLGRSELGLQLVLEALAVLREKGDVYGEGEALCELGVIKLDTGHIEEAHQHASEALAIIARLGGHRFETFAYGLYAAIQFELGRPDEAYRNLNTALRVATTGNDRYGITDAQIRLAHAELRLGNTQAADTLAMTALASAKEYGYRMLEGYALLALGRQDEGYDVLRECGSALQEWRIRAYVDARCTSSVGSST